VIARNEFFCCILKTFNIRRESLSIKMFVTISFIPTKNVFFYFSCTTHPGKTLLELEKCTAKFERDSLEAESWSTCPFYLFRTPSPLSDKLYVRKKNRRSFLECKHFSFFRISLCFHKRMIIRSTGNGYK